MKEAEVEQQIRQLGPGKFRCDLAMRSTEQADFFADRSPHVRRIASPLITRLGLDPSRFVPAPVASPSLHQANRTCVFAGVAAGDEMPPGAGVPGLLNRRTLDCEPPFDAAVFRCGSGSPVARPRIPVGCVAMEDTLQ